MAEYIIANYNTNRKPVEDFTELRSKVFSRQYEGKKTIYDEINQYDTSYNSFFVLAVDGDRILGGKRLVISKFEEDLPQNFYCDVKLKEHIPEIFPKSYGRFPGKMLTLAEQGGFAVDQSLEIGEKQQVIKGITQKMFQFLKDNKVDVLTGLAFDKGRSFEKYCAKEKIDLYTEKLWDDDSGHSKGCGGTLMVCSLNNEINISAVNKRGRI